MCLDFREISDLASQRILFAKCNVSDCAGTGGVMLQKPGWKIKDKEQQVCRGGVCRTLMLGLNLMSSLG